MSSSDEEILSKKKKKKKTVKRKVDSDDEASDDEVKKEKKEQRVKSPDPAQKQRDSDSDFETLEEFYAHLKTCKRRKKRGTNELAQVDGAVDWDKFQGNDREYTYPEILRLVMERIQSNNPQLGTNHKTKVRPPIVQRDGTKKVAFTNFAEICKSLNRTLDHVSAFILTELGTTGNIDGQENLILKGRLTGKHIEGLLRKYIEAYVTCSMCKSADTHLVKDSHTRLTTLVCNSCSASRTVQSITGGFSAQIGRRKRK